MLRTSDTAEQSSGLIAQIYCRTEEAGYKKTHIREFHLCKAENQAKLVGGDRLLDGGNLYGEGVGWEGSPRGF